MSRKAGKNYRILEKVEEPAEFGLARKNKQKQEKATKRTTATKKTRAIQLGKQENYYHKTC